MITRRDQQICSHIFEHWAERNSVEIQEQWAPEDDPAEESGLRIELAVQSPGRLFALEHTKVGPYLSYERDGAITNLLETRIKESEYLLSNFEHLSISLPVEWHRVIKLSCLAGALSEAIEAIVEELRNQTEFKGNAPNLRRKIRQLDVLFSLRPSTQANRGIWIKLLAPSDVELEKQRLERLAKKLPAKTQKLQRWKERGASTILILEDRDLQISNEALVASGVRAVLEAQTTKPDFVLYLDATIRSEWTVLPIFENGNWDAALFDEIDLERFWHLPPL